MKRNVLLFEEFKKTYKQGITREEFKNLEKGEKVFYEGTQYEIETPGEYAIELKSDKGKFTVNYSMFNEKGAIAEKEEDKEKEMK